MTQKELDEIIVKHAKWLNGEDGGERANLAYANLAGTVLTRANLKNANLECANLKNANLAYANLECANLECMNLVGTVLTRANLKNANLAGANLAGANLNGAKNIPFISIACPEEGEFIAFKKVGRYIIKLRIPSEAKRSSATSRKCRAEFADVLEIQRELEFCPKINSYLNIVKTTLDKKSITGLNEKIYDYIMSEIYDKIYPKKPYNEDIKIYQQSIKLSWAEPEDLIKSKNKLFFGHFLLMFLIA
jgi:hypothetical protein